MVTWEWWVPMASGESHIIHHDKRIGGETVRRWGNLAAKKNPSWSLSLELLVRLCSHLMGQCNLENYNIYIYTCIFQRAWISACGGNWKLRRKVILSIFWGILIRSWWTIQVKRNAVWVMFAVFLFWFLIFIFFFGRKHPRNGRKHPRNRRKHPKWDFHVKQ